MRDHRRLVAYRLADELVTEIYKATRSFPKEEMYGLTSQMRRATISVPANIVEACAKFSERAFVHQLETAHGSSRELAYLIDLSIRLGYLASGTAKPLMVKSDEVCRTLAGLIKSLRRSMGSSD